MDVREIAKQNVLMQNQLFIQYQVSLSSVLMLRAHFIWKETLPNSANDHACIHPNQILYILDLIDNYTCMKEGVDAWPFAI